MLSVYEQSGKHSRLIDDYCGFKIQTFCSDVRGDHRRSQTLAEMCKNICCGFRSVAARVKYPGFL